jgi:hypothetical protein
MIKIMSALAVCILLTACSENNTQTGISAVTSSSSQSSQSSKALELPKEFPSYMPVMPEMTLVSIVDWRADDALVYDISWESLKTPRQILTFYKQHMEKNGWKDIEFAMQREDGGYVMFFEKGRDVPENEQKMGLIAASDRMEGFPTVVQFSFEVPFAQ